MRFQPLSDIPNAHEQLSSYSDLYTSEARVFCPSNVEELRRIFAFARERGHRITFRGGGHSFDAQSLGDDLVVSLTALDTIEVDPREKRLRVGPGATWGAILAKLEPLGLVPATTVTTSHASAGGTLSGDCLSRFSPAYGKEGKWIVSFELLTTEGELLTCTPPREDVSEASWTRGERAFSGVIGGLGYLGAVVSITYELLFVGQTAGRIGVRTRVRKFHSFAELAKELVPIAKKTYLEKSDPCDESKVDAIYSALYTSDSGEPSTLLFTSSYTTSPDRRRMAVHEPNLAVRPLVEWIMRIPWLNERLWPIYYGFIYKDGEEYIDDLSGFTFFMDGNVRARDLAKRFGFKLTKVQQTFIIPSDPGAEGGWDRTKDDLLEWLEFAHRYFQERDLRPTLHDVLFLPQDGRFLLSATAGLAGFAVSYAFETSDDATIEAVKRTFAELADVLWDKFRGRVYLVKNVHASEETLAKMYGDRAEAFFALKADLDPKGILVNGFLERTFGGLVRASRGGAAAA